MGELHYVEIVKYADETVILRLGPFKSERLADKVESGANINLNHDDYFTRVQSNYIDDALVLNAMAGLVKDVEASRNDEVACDQCGMPKATCEHSSPGDLERFLESTL